MLWTYLFIFASKNGLYPDCSLPWPEPFSSLAQTATSKHPRNTNSRNVPEIKVNIFNFEVEQTGYLKRNRNTCNETAGQNLVFSAKIPRRGSGHHREEALRPWDKTLIICQKSSKFYMILYIKIFVEDQPIQPHLSLSWFSNEVDRKCCRALVDLKPSKSIGQNNGGPCKWKFNGQLYAREQLSNMLNIILNRC